MKSLSPRDQRFVELYVLGRPATEAARLAGFKEGTARRAAWKILKRPEIAEAVKAIREDMRRVANEDRDTFIKELNFYIDESREDGERSAVMKGMEIKSKVMGIQQETTKHLHFHTKIDLRAAIENAKARVLKHEQARHAIDTTFTEVPADPARRLLED
jgi:phage terminase small subunit